MPTEQTATVTPLHPQVTHFESCDRDVYGRAVVWYMEGDPDLITAENIRGFVRGWREAGEPCDCIRSQLRTVLDDLAVARKAFRACLSEENAQRVADLVAKRDRLRGMA